MFAKVITRMKMMGPIIRKFYQANSIGKSHWDGGTKGCLDD